MSVPVSAPVSATKNGRSHATTTEYIYAGDILLATVEQVFLNNLATGTPTTRYVHPDHLGSTNVISNTSRQALQVLDYYPYGSQRVASTTNNFNEKRKFIGQYADDPTYLSYLNARYYDGNRGQFLSEDPVFLSLGDPTRLQQLSQQEQNKLLADPQQLNSYNYGRDNPVTQKDPNGLGISAALEIAFSIAENIQRAQYTRDTIGYTTDRFYGVNGPTDTTKLIYGTVTLGAGLLAPDPVSKGLLILDFSSQGIEAYCSGHTCKNYLDTGQNPQDVVKNIISSAAPKSPAQFSGLKNSNVSSGNGSNSSQQNTLLNILSGGGSGSLRIGNNLGSFSGTYDFGPGGGIQYFQNSQLIAPPSPSTSKKK